MMKFDEAWEEIMKFLANQNEVKTLVRKISNKIISINSFEVRVRSEATGVVRSIPKDQFRDIWENLLSNGFFRTQDHGPYVHSQIIAAIIVKAGLAKYECNPLTLKLISQ